MKVRSLAAVAAAISLMTTPVIAQAASSDVSRIVAPLTQESGVEGDNSPVLYIVGGVLAAVGLFFILDDDDDDKPASP